MNFFSNFRNQMIIFFGVSSIIIGLIIIFYISNIVSSKVIEDNKKALFNTSKIVANKITDILFERDREIMLLSKNPIFNNKQLDTQNIREILKNIENSYSIYSWIGIADNNGIIKVAANGLSEGVNASSRPWFINGSKERYIGDIHEAVLLAKFLTPSTNGEPLRFIDFASPIKDTEGNLLGVVATHINWDWLTEQIKTYLPDDLDEQSIEVLIVEKNRKVIYPFVSVGDVLIPEGILKKEGSYIQTWDNNEEYLISLHKISANISTNLEWSIILRQPISKALEPIDKLHKTFIIIGSIFTLINIFIVFLISKEFSKPLEKLVKIANSIENGNENIEFNVSTKISEILLLSDSLKSMLKTLILKKHQLENINITLEQKVQDRTRKLEKLNEDLKLFARKDALTGLNNRFAANERLKEEFLRMKRNKIQYSVAIVDIDFFKKVNDTYGHEVGDTVLKEVSKILQNSARTTDFVARFGGEEFILIFPEITQNNAFLIAEKIRVAVANSIISYVDRITISIGVSVSNIDDDNEDKVVKKADIALYKAKELGRNQVKILV